MSSLVQSLKPCGVRNEKKDDSRKDAKHAKFGMLEEMFSLRAWGPFDGVYPERSRRAQDMLGAIDFLEVVL